MSLSNDDQNTPVPRAAKPQAKTSEYTVWLAVPHEDRGTVREAAGRLDNGRPAVDWDKEAKLWFAHPGADLDRVQQWLPDSSVRAGGGDPEAQFLDALTQAGLVLKGLPIMDGQKHRVATVEDKKGKQSGVYRGYLDRRPGGWFINYHRAETEKSVTKWSAQGGETDPRASLHIRAAARQSQEDAARAREQLYARQTQAAKRLYDRLPAADPEHPYLVRKGIPPTPELRQTKNGALVVPFFNASGLFKTLQYIPPQGEKFLFEDAPKQGHFLVVGGSLNPGQQLLYAEGYATARSLNLATGQPVVMTIDAGNMLAVAKVLHERFPENPHLFLADFDHAKEQNKGLLMAQAAAKEVGGQVLYPDFTEAEKASGLTDFNDLHHSRGLDAVRSQVGPALLYDSEEIRMQDDQAVSEPAARDLAESNLPPASPAPLAFTHNGEPASLGLAPGAQSTHENEPMASNGQAAPVTGPSPLAFTHNGAPASLGLPPVFEGRQAQAVPDNSERREPVTGPSPLAFVHNGEPVSLGLQQSESPSLPDPVAAEPRALHHSEPGSGGLISDVQQALEAQWTAHQLGVVSQRASTERSVFSEVEGLLKNQQLELNTQIVALRNDSSGRDSDTVKRHLETLQTVDLALKEMSQGQGSDTDSATLPLLESFKQGMIGAEQGILQGRGIDGSTRDEWVKQQMQRPGTADVLSVQVDGRAFAAQRTARAEELLSRVLLGSRAGVTELIRDEIKARHLENDTVVEPVAVELKASAPVSVEAPTVIAPGADHQLSGEVVPTQESSTAASRRADEQLGMDLQSAPVAEADTETVVRPEVDHQGSVEATPSPEPIEPQPAPLLQAAGLEEDVEPDQAPPVAIAPGPVDADSQQQSPVVDEAPVVMPRASGDAGSEAAPATGAEVDAIWVGAPRPIGADTESPLSNIDKDLLLTRLDRVIQDDKTVLYTLDGEPAFIDHGNRLAMAKGTSDNDEKVLAALLTAAEYYRGRIELTGSDEFKAKAIQLIAQHQVNVMMKNPAQQAMLMDAREALVKGPAVVDAVTGVSPPAYGPIEPILASQASLVVPMPVQPQAHLASLPESSLDVAAGADISTQARYADTGLATGQFQAAPLSAPVEEHLVVVPDSGSKPYVAPIPVPAGLVIEPDPTPTPQKNPGRSRGIPPEIHQSYDAAKNGVVGKVMACGSAPYRFKQGEADCPYIKLRTKTGPQTFWGKELAGLLRQTRVQPGKMVQLQWLGKEPVLIQVPQKNADGVTTGYRAKETHRNQWALTVSGHATVRTGQDEGVKLAAYDAARFAVVQQALINRLGLELAVPTPPRDGLYWMTPNGQGSAKAGDELSAPRPGIDPQRSAGQSVISSWSHDGHLEMHLVRGDGHYLQGVVRQDGQLQNVLVSLPGTPDAPPMVFNAITPEGLVPIGTGNGINRSGGEPVARENIVFKLEGDSAVRIGKLDSPGEVPATLHARMGFDERWKADSNLPKSAPTAAPTVQPGDPRPSA